MKELYIRRVYNNKAIGTLKPKLIDSGRKRLGDAEGLDTHVENGQGRGQHLL